MKTLDQLQSEYDDVQRRWIRMNRFMLDRMDKLDQQMTLAEMEARNGRRTLATKVPPAKAAAKARQAIQRGARRVRGKLTGAGSGVASGLGRDGR